jgi:polyhydroxybutyrate depolymerase
VTSTPGCAVPYEGERGAWVLMPSLNVGGDARTFWLWVPPTYDPEIEYPVVFLFHGCGDESNNLPLEDYAGDDAILVRGLSNGPGGCWVTSDETDAEFFEAMLTAVSTAVCADEHRIFAVGYDSGAELVSRLGCYQAYLIDGVATVAGDNALTYGATCNGPVAALMIHDEDDTEQDIDGSEQVRDRLVDQNFCVTDGIPEPVDPEPCLRYSGCGEPVLWCATSGRGHDRQDDFAAPAIWDFFSSL